MKSHSTFWRAAGRHSRPKVNIPTPMLGDCHPSALGLPFDGAWPDIGNEIVLRASEAKYRSLFDNMADGFAVCGSSQ